MSRSYLALRQALGIPRGVPRAEMRFFWSHRYYHGAAYDWATHQARQADLDAKRSAKRAQRIARIKERVK